MLPLKRLWLEIVPWLKRPLSILLGITLILIVIAASALALIENGVNPEITGFVDGLWWSLIFVTSGFEQTPATNAGRFIALGLVLFNLLFLGLLTANISALLIEQRLGLKRRLNPMELNGHIIICGYNHRVQEIIAQLHAPDVEHKAIVVLAPNIDPKTDFESPMVVAIQGDPAVAKDLRLAGVEKASAAIILGSFNSNHDNSSDARAVLITLAIESINPKVRTCVEVSDPANIPHLEYAKADEIVNSGGLSANLLSQAALYPGITQVYNELLSNIVGNEIYQIQVPPHFTHHTVRELHGKLLDKGCILVGVRWLSGENKGLSKINPPLNSVVMPGDELMLISEHRPKI